MVPFTPSAGVLEWVNGTVPLGEYLIGRSVNLHAMWYYTSLLSYGDMSLNIVLQHA